MCKNCHLYKELNDFYKDKTRFDGHEYNCKVCKKSTVSNRYRKNKPPKKIESFEERKNRIRAINRKAGKVYIEKHKNDERYKMKRNLRIRINRALKNNQKSGHTLELLGCTINEFKIYLQSKFDGKMSWENYGTYWEIDHIKPCALFDLRNPSEQMECFHYTNMQPMETSKNRSKGDSYNG